MFLFIIFNLPEAAYAEDRDNKPEVNINIEVNKGGKNEIYKSIEFNGNTEPVININKDLDNDDEDNRNNDDGENNNSINNGGNAGDIDVINNGGDNHVGNEIQNNNIGGDNNTENNDDENNEDENENGDEGNSEYINNDGDESYNNNEVNENNENNGEENSESVNRTFRYIKFVSEAISVFNEHNHRISNEQKINYIKFGSSLTNAGREPVRSGKEHKEPLNEINLLLFKSLNTKKEKINQELGITVNGAGDILNLFNMIERYSIVKVINFDEIIDIDYKKDIAPDNESEWGKNLPEFIPTFWNNIKSMSALYN